MIPGVDPVFTWNNISPRIGFAYDVGGNNKTVIRGSFGVYYDGNVGGNWNAPAIDPSGAVSRTGGPRGTVPGTRRAVLGWFPAGMSASTPT